MKQQVRNGKEQENSKRKNGKVLGSIFRFETLLALSFSVCSFVSFLLFAFSHFLLADGL
jgi:hypothetical protein